MAGWSAVQLTCRPTSYFCLTQLPQVQLLSLHIAIHTITFAHLYVLHINLKFANIMITCIHTLHKYTNFRRKIAHGSQKIPRCIVRHICSSLQIYIYIYIPVSTYIIIYAANHSGLLKWLCNPSGRGLPIRQLYW